MDVYADNMAIFVALSVRMVMLFGTIPLCSVIVERRRNISKPSNVVYLSDYKRLKSF